MDVSVIHTATLALSVGGGIICIVDTVTVCMAVMLGGPAVCPSSPIPPYL